jgi:DNA-binding XRE family transcriptional regulator
MAGAARTHPGPDSIICAAPRGGWIEGRLSDVVYVDILATLVFKFVDGRVCAVLLGALEGIDASSVTRVSLSSDGYAALVEQESGNRVEVPWDVVLYHAEPRYPYYKDGRTDKSGQQRAETIGRRIRSQRTERRWTLGELSRRTGIKPPNLCRLEKGRHTPSLETLEKVADAFGMPVAALVSARASSTQNGGPDVRPR